MDVVVEQVPPGGGVGAEVAEGGGDVAERDAALGGGRADRFLRGTDRPPRHGVQVARVQEGLACPGTVSRGGQPPRILESRGRCTALAERRQAGLVAGGGAHEHRHAGGLRAVDHLPQVRPEVPCRRLAQRRFRGDHRLPHHLLHE
ncbi:MAG: hypothetical protein ACK559_11295, partial [bacterium]